MEGLRNYWKKANVLLINTYPSFLHCYYNYIWCKLRVTFAWRCFRDVAGACPDGLFRQEIYNFHGTFGKHLSIFAYNSSKMNAQPLLKSCILQKYSVYLFPYNGSVLFLPLGPITFVWYCDAFFRNCVDCAMHRLWFLTVRMSPSWCHDKTAVMKLWFGVIDDSCIIYPLFAFQLSKPRAWKPKANIKKGNMSEYFIYHWLK